MMPMCIESAVLIGVVGVELLLRIDLNLVGGYRAVGGRYPRGPRHNS